MPIYEYYCPACHVIFNFLSRSIRTEKKPKCPRCKRPNLEKQMSRFAAIGRANETSSHNETGSEPAMDARMEKALESMASDVETMGDDPRSAAQLMRKLSGAAGVRMNDTMEQALQRIESGEDPDQIEADMGNALAAEDPFGVSKDKRTGQRKRTSLPERDETLHEL